MHDAVERMAAADAADAQTTTVDLPTSSVDASTCHYLVVGLGLAHGSTQTDWDDLTLAELRWYRCMQGQDASGASQPAQEQEEAVEPQPEEVPPPVFADCSHYMSTPATTSRAEKRRSRKDTESPAPNL